MALIKCSECGNEVSNKAQSCPKCGAKVTVKAGFSVIKLIGLLFFGGIVYLAMIADKPSVTSSPASSVSSQNLEAVDVAFKKAQYGNRVVAGLVPNTTGKKYGYVQVEINLFDKQGTQVGSTLANVNNLDVGTTWAFEAPVLDDRVKSAKIAGITAY